MKGWRPAGRGLRGIVLAALVLAFATPTAAARVGYVSDPNGEAVFPFDTATNRPGTPIKVSGDPDAIAIAPDGRTAYVVSETGEKVTPIDTRTNLAGAPIKVGFFAEAIAITPDGSTAYVVIGGNNTVTPIDLRTNAPGSPITVLKNPRDVAVSHDGRTAYIVDSGSEAITPIDIATNAVGGPIPFPGHPVAIATVPGSEGAYVVNEETAGSVVPLNLRTGALGTAIPVGKFPNAIAITPDGRTAYVANGGGESVTPIDIRTGKAGAAIKVGLNPISIAITPDGRTAYVANYFSASVTPIDTRTNLAGAPIPTTENAASVAIVPSQTPRSSFAIGPARAGRPVSFDATASSDPFGAIASYAWGFGDGQVASGGPTIAHTFAAPGTYRVTLSADNGEDCPGPLFTGRTASCAGASTASTTQAVVVSPALPRVRVHCPKSAGHGGCRFKLRIVAKRTRRGAKRAPKAQSAVAKTKVGAGRSALVTLQPKPAFAVRLGAARQILVAETVTIAGRTRTAYQRLKNVP